jgi:putative tributyrin esterase
MALLRCDFFSDVLEMGTSMTVLLPQASQEQIGVVEASPGADGGFPVLYLLHGLSDDGTAWSRFTSIERYAAELGLAVVMPQVGRSFYADEVHGGRYWTFLSEELPAVVDSFSTSPGGARTRSSPACRWAATARSSGRCTSPSGSPRWPACPVRWTPSR